MWEYNHFDEMYHAGIKGMKWGVRRFQNKDGSLTDAGRRRYKDNPEGSDATGDKKRTLFKKKGSSSESGDETEKSESLKSKITKKIAERKQKKAEEAAKESEEKKQKEAEAEANKPKKTSDMSDAELRERINRLGLEKQYNQLVSELNPEKTHKVRDFVGRVIERSGENLLTQVANHYGAKALNKIIGETETIFDKEAGVSKTVLKEVIFANNKKKG